MNDVEQADFDVELVLEWISSVYTVKEAAKTTMFEGTELWKVWVDKDLLDAITRLSER